MSEIVIKVENLSKSYIIGHENKESYTALRDVLVSSGQNIIKKSISLLSGKNKTTKNNLEEFWALDDINFEISKGDRVGIVGSNGAGKSTLLKVLSRITDPTGGKIKIKGRIASLLEVGTGFHPELTGRENIYLNGAIIGMKRSEINKKFDEIVDFSGVEKFLDTPVKRYSSGMYVRLAFSVAANLESEILIIDEVLAVGDAEFQKKCLGKMDDVSREEGRTVLFVSHNMAAMQNLCKKGILMSKGKVQIMDDMHNVISKYLEINKAQSQKLSDILERKGRGNARFIEGIVRDIKSNLISNIETFSEINFEINFEIKKHIKIITSRIAIGINNNQGDRIAWLSSDITDFKITNDSNKINFIVNNFPFSPGDYNCNLFFEINNEIEDWLFNVLPFSVLEKDYYGYGKNLLQNQGNILLNYKTM